MVIETRDIYYLYVEINRRCGHDGRTSDLFGGFHSESWRRMMDRFYAICVQCPYAPPEAVVDMLTEEGLIPGL